MKLNHYFALQILYKIFSQHKNERKKEKLMKKLINIFIIKNISNTGDKMNFPEISIN